MVDDALQRYRDLAAKVDAFVARVAARHPEELRCAPGCAGCCTPGLTVTSVEADRLIEHVRGLDAGSRAALAARLAATEEDSDRCAALGAGDRCLVYDARPLVCRSHGVPVRMRSPRGLPVVTACELNFTARGPAAADADCVLDQATLSATLLAIDRLHAAAAGREAGGRYALGDVLAAALAEDAP